MSWKSFLVVVGVLMLGNIFVYAQTDLPTTIPTSLPSGLPSGIPDPNQYNRVPEGALSAINNVSPAQVSQLPESVRQDLARRQQDIQDQLRQETLRSTGSPVVDGNLPISSGASSPNPTSSGSPAASGSGASFDPLNLASNYLADDDNIRQSNIADTLDLATKFEMQLWRQYYNTIAEDTHDLYDVYGDISDAFDDYSQELDTMLNRLPHTVSNCQRQ